MDLPLFSQVPAAILRKIEPSQRKKVKFNHELNSFKVKEEEVSSSWPDPDGELNSLRLPELLKQPPTLFGNPNVLLADNDSIEPPQINKSNEIVYTNQSNVNCCCHRSAKEVANATLQVAIEVATKSTQTEMRCLKPTDLAMNNMVHSDPELAGFGGYKPMYSIPKRNGTAPPLKIGLSLPKGRKRKVFYPDEEYKMNQEIEES